MADGFLALLEAEEATRPFLRGRANTVEVSEAVGFPASERVGARIGLLTLDRTVHYVAGLEGETRSDPVRRSFVLRSLTTLDHPLPVQRLAAVLRTQQQRPIHEGGGAFTKAASELVLQALIEHQPSLGPLLNELRSGPRMVHDPVEEQVRDSLVSAMAFTGHAPELDEDDVAPLEKDLIARDAREFLGWDAEETGTLGARRFSDGAGRVLKVMDVDRKAIEDTAGPDLIYYHVQRECFVLVQYKRMTKSGDKWVYRADKQLDKQLAAMTVIDQRCLKAEDPAGAAPFRIVGTPSFVKICAQKTYAMESRSVAQGMCMPRRHVEWYLTRGRTLSYEVVKDSLSSSAFAGLVALGLVGSSPAASDVIREELRATLGRVVFAEFSDPTGARPTGRPSRPGRARALLTDEVPLPGDRAPAAPPETAVPYRPESSPVTVRRAASVPVPEKPLTLFDVGTASAG